MKKGEHKRSFMKWEDFDDVQIIRLDGVSFYWNSRTSLISHLEDKSEIREALEKGIAKSDYLPADYCYIVNPISLDVKLVLNPKPENDEPKFSIPKADMILKMTTVCISVQKYQYQDVLEFLEAQERFALNAKYRKYRPDVAAYAGNSKTWYGIL
ncbi:unnamed protein product [Soboliphyme baturini]|uniref:VPS13 domain-containing protein n=1 Tax=Soboliphyme baturini TaxID=241478 RepID=A0A183I9R5_9BILA|nr:unnamed protein product [Soboliphyme baturini]